MTELLDWTTYGGGKPSLTREQPNETDLVVIAELEHGLRMWALLGPSVAIGLTLLDLVTGTPAEFWTVAIRLMATLPFVGLVFFLRLTPRRWAFELAALGVSVVIAFGCAAVVLVTGGATSVYVPFLAAAVVGLAVYVPQRERVSLPFYLASLAFSIACVVLGSPDSLAQDQVVRAVRAMILAHFLGGFGIVVNVARVRRLMKAEHERREEAGRRTLAAERERIARDLHDSVGAQLAGIHLLAERHRRSAGPGVGHWRELGELAQLGMQELRDAIWALASEERDCVSLMAELRQRIELLTSAANCELTWQVEGVDQGPSYGAPLSFALLSIAREAVSNALRHGRPRHLEARIAFRPDAVALSLEDDGSGLPEHLQPGRGLANMARRAESLGGFAHVERRPQGGTRVHARLPIASAVPLNTAPVGGATWR